MKQPLRVPFEMDIDALARVLDGRVCGERVKKGIQGICLDSRVLEERDAFFALPAVRDGHNFIENAVEKGASIVVLSNPEKAIGPYIHVKDTLRSFQKLATYWKDQWEGEMIAISGSNGKTSTKEIIYSLLSQKYECHKSPGTWNNHLGIPLSLLLLKKKHQCCILEMGMNHTGELKQLCEIAKPNIGVLTNIGRAHLEEFGSLEGIAKAKEELFEGVLSDGLLIVNKDDERVMKAAENKPQKIIYFSKYSKADVFIKNITKSSDQYNLHIQYGKESIAVYTKIQGEHNISNLMCALAASYATKLSGSFIQEGIDRICLPKMRMEKVVTKQGISIVIDCYNANPESTKAALDSMNASNNNQSIFVMGDMMELGEYAAIAHREVGKYAIQKGITHVIAMGQFAKDLIQGAIEAKESEVNLHICQSKKEIAKLLQTIASPKDTILLKGSRGMKMEEVLVYLDEGLAGEV